MTEIKGGCLCGAVSYQAEVETPLAMSCYCTDCQRSTGSSCASFVAVPAASFELKGAPKSFTKKGESGMDVTRYFCAECGCQLYSEVEVRPGMYFVKLGSLESSDDLAPRVHIWTGSKASWVELPEGAPAFDKNPQ